MTELKNVLAKRRNVNVMENVKNVLSSIAKMKKDRFHIAKSKARKNKLIKNIANRLRRGEY